MPHKYSPSQWDTIVQEAVESDDYRSVASRYGVTVEGLTYQVKKRGLFSPRAIGAPRKHTLAVDFFDTLNERSAYWLGFIMADGGVYKTSTLYKSPNRLTLNVSVKDEGHLQKFINDIRSTAKIETYIPKGTYSTAPMSRVSINSVGLCRSLNNYGVVERKTGKECLPHNIPDKLVRHFVRGYFDGDGTIVVYSERYRSYFSIIGNRAILSYIQVHLVSDCGLNYTKLTKEPDVEGLYYLAYGGRQQLQRIYDYLYSGADVFLERKKEKFLLALSD
jgi:hypothetical protein